MKRIQLFEGLLIFSEPIFDEIDMKLKKKIKNHHKYLMIRECFSLVHNLQGLWGY